ncbi:MAG: UDP-N-acetylglucosamine 1-carboxyvinyltransferase [Candidatus Magasanikbacteria bacterium CG_4_9_14_3_um_filter_32_9]|uniref:UDP-N-acetylglucosamine 1-carboxyvinyltransferase n=1 Tax=Candidatus Magasanikbacteria bacterium CG_4_9_14_3_um_filter_32_9 TaxID=1974644 RepID=A0A2M7Z7R8_9BACT|nr:MAG: UDP-N-acetylglucosamine 1-carboxyvinyltransferase [Candidatus Magasanikbacteria bacterium CG_4_9_14_3_um_filter_32_9]
MPKFVIEGGKKLSGKIKVNTAKNSAVAILCASLMIKGKVYLEDIPRIQEVDRILEILGSIGVRFEWTGSSDLLLDTSAKLQLDKIDKKACRITRSSLLLFGALAKRESKGYKLYKSGGCKLGERTVRPHIFGLEKLGLSIVSKTGYYEVKTKKLQSSEVVMYESGDTTTENVIMAAVLANGTTTLKFASANYMVQDLCYFLNKAGADIKGIGSTTMVIKGVKSLKPTKKPYSLIPDPIEAMTFLSLAITTRSNIIIENCPLDFLELELEKLSVMGQKYNIVKKYLSKNGKFNMADIEILPSELSALPDKIYGRPFPGLNIDNLPFFVPILTQAKGRTLVHDWVYENRAIYFLELQKLGANLILLDPHRVFVEGPTALKGNELMCPPAIRPATAILICMLAASGKSVLRNSYPIERGYEDLAGRLQQLGANIERVE